MKTARTRRRNLIVLVQTRDLDEVRPKVEKALKKFDPAFVEVMPGVWHLAAVADQSLIKTRVVMAVSDWDDDRVMVIDNPDGWSTWDGHRGQHVRTEELKERWVVTHDLKRGKSHSWRRVDLNAAPSPEWVTQRRLTGTRIS